MVYSTADNKNFYAKITGDDMFLSCMFDADTEEARDSQAAADVGDGVDENIVLHANSWIQEI